MAAALGRVMLAGFPVGGGPRVVPQGLLNDPPLGCVGSQVGMKPS